MSALRQLCRHYLLALQFFTRIPVTGGLADWVGYSPGMLRASAAHFPGVGWLVGALVAAVTALLLAGLPSVGFAPLIAAVWGTAFWVLITGAFHEDGLADVADGLGGSPDRERALIIMKDSRVGAFGAISIGLVLLAKVSVLALLGSVNCALLCTALFLAHVVSRTWPLLLIRLMLHIGDAAGSKSKPLADQISARSLYTAFIWCFMALDLVVYAQMAINFIATDALAMVLLQALVTVVAASGMAFWSCGVGSGGACKALPGMPAAPFPYREVDFFKEDRQQGIPNPLRVTGPSKNIERGGFIGKSTTPPTRCHNAGTSDGDVDECIDHNIADSTQFFESKALVNSSKWRFVSTAAVYKAIRRQDGLLSPRFTR